MEWALVHLEEILLTIGVVLLGVFMFRLMRL